MPGRAINLLVVHCSATPNGVRLGTANETAAQVIDGWHRDRGFHRDEAQRRRFHPELAAIGYHFVIDTDGRLLSGRHIHEVGAHVAGHNLDSIGVCMVGNDAFTPSQWTRVAQVLRTLTHFFPRARVCGHRDLSADSNHDGTIQPSEWIKTCPGFNVEPWWAYTQYAKAAVSA